MFDKKKEQNVCSCTTHIVHICWLMNNMLKKNSIKKGSYVSDFVLNMYLPEMRRIITYTYGFEYTPVHVHKCIATVHAYKSEWICRMLVHIDFESIVRLFYFLLAFCLPFIANTHDNNTRKVMVKTCETILPLLSKKHFPNLSLCKSNFKLCLTYRKICPKFKISMNINVLLTVLPSSNFKVLLKNWEQFWVQSTKQQEQCIYVILVRCSWIEIQAGILRLPDERVSILKHTHT